MQLEMGKEGKLCGSGQLSSGGLGPCVAVGIYDVTKKCGYMCHQNSPDVGPELEDFIAHVLTQCAVTDAKVCATGAAIDEDDHMVTPESVRQSRDYTIDLLRRHFAEHQIDFRWLQNDWGELHLDIETGTFSVDDCNFP